MRSGLWMQYGFARLSSSPVLAGIAHALAELYEPLMRERLPERWTMLIARFEAGRPGEG